MTAEHETPPMIEVLEFVSLDRPWTNDEYAEVQRALEATRYVVTGASTPEALRRRAARAYYRCAAVEALRGNNLTEHQKGWLVSWTEGPGAAAVVLDAWAESADPHAALDADGARIGLMGSARNRAGQFRTRLALSG